MSSIESKYKLTPSEEREAWAFQRFLWERIWGVSPDFWNTRLGRFLKDCRFDHHGYWEMEPGGWWTNKMPQMRDGYVFVPDDDSDGWWFINDDYHSEHFWSNTRPVYIDGHLFVSEVGWFIKDSVLAPTRPDLHPDPEDDGCWSWIPPNCHNGSECYGDYEDDAAIIIDRFILRFIRFYRVASRSQAVPPAEQPSDDEDATLVAVAAAAPVVVVTPAPKPPNAGDTGGACDARGAGGTGTEGVTPGDSSGSSSEDEESGDES